MIKSGTIFIVHHVDTEGPMREPISETFKRVENTFNIKIDFPRTKANLKKLQRGELIGDNPLLIKQVKKLLSSHSLDLNEKWEDIDTMLYLIMNKKFRNHNPDSFSGGWIFNWHIMDHVGFKTNKRYRDLGYFKIFNHYKDIIKKTNSRQDGIHWHFHPISFFKEAHVSATSYENSFTEIHQILSRRLIEENWFPKVNRAGFHSERPDSNCFLEQWIPFDPSNQSVEIKDNEVQVDAINGRFGDWAGAPSDWSLYHPDIYDWRKKGHLNRVIGRVLNLDSRFRNISSEEIEKAFRIAKKGQDVYLGVTNHDFREMSVEIEMFRNMLQSISSKYPKVKYKFSESVEAFRNVLGLNQKEIKENRIDFECVLKENVLSVDIVCGEPFGPQPYLAIKTKNGEYFHDNLDFGEFKKTYFYTFDRYTVPIDDIEKISLASNDKYGNCCIINIKLKNEKFSIKKILS